jgi:trehalose-6-phosphate synthase
MNENGEIIFTPFVHGKSHKYKETAERIVNEKILQKFVQQTIDDISKMVNEIHQEFGHGCLVFKYQSLDYEQRCALWSTSNIYLNTSLKEGACMQLLEFVTVKYF